MRIAVLATALSSAVVGLALADPATAAIRTPTSIAPQELSSALRVLAADRRLQILYTTETVANRQTAGAVGEFTVVEALTRLLSGTGLVFRYVDENTITIMPRAENTPSYDPATPLRGAVNTSEPSKSFWSRLRLAQADTPSPSRGEGRSEDREQAAGDQKVEDPAQLQKRVELEEIVVTGTRIKSDDGGPRSVVTFDRDQIARLGAATVVDVLKYLPQQSFTESEVFAFGGSYGIRLRGLAYGSTLVLVDGRRTVTSALAAGRGAYFDLNSIPLAAVERIEVLSDSASAVYGADAVAGVVNIVLKREIPEPVVEVYYGGANGGGDERRASLSIGRHSARFSGSLVLDYFDRDDLLGIERDLLADQNSTRFGSLDRRSAAANPGNVTSLTTANLPGLPARFAAVPIGSTGVGLTQSSFLATAGQRNLESLNSYRSVLPNTHRRGAFAKAQFKLAERLNAFGDVLYMSRDDLLLSAPPAFSGTVPATNPFNPFGVSVRADFLVEGVGFQRSVNDSESYRATAGLNGAAGDWDWEIAAFSTDEDATNFNDNRLDPARVAAALASTDPALSLNVFQDGPGGSPDLLASLLAVPALNESSSKSRQVDGFVRGSLLELPAGDLMAVFGAEGRREDLHFELLPNIDMTADRDTWSAFSEFRVPLVPSSSPALASGRAVLTVAGRYDHYSDFGDAFNPQYGIEWYVMPRLKFWGNYGTSFRAPSLFELYAPARSIPGTLTDPRRNEVVPVTVLAGGNPNLEPEESDSWTVGLSQSYENLELDMSYWKVTQDPRLQALSVNTFVANEQFFPERVIRDAPTAADVAAGLPGRLLAVDSTGINFGRLRTAGVDFRVSGQFDLRAGRLLPSLSATWIEQYETADFPTSPRVERVGVGSTEGSIPRWRATGAMAWDWRAFSLGSTLRWRSSYQDVNALNQRNGREISAQWFVDLQASVQIGELAGGGGWADGLVARAGAINVFDEEPDFSEMFSIGADPSQADLRQRFLYVSIRKAF